MSSLRLLKIVEPNGKTIAVDVNEDNIAFGSGDYVTNIKTCVKMIRTTYFLKHRRP